MGPLTFGKKEEQIFLGREIAQHRDFSEETAIRSTSGEEDRYAQFERAKAIIEEIATPWCGWLNAYLNARHSIALRFVASSPVCR